jgi:putative flavoprotein involved in K+ transport
MELCATHRTYLSGPDKGQVPFRIESRKARVLFPILWFVASRLLTVRTPLGRKIRPHVIENGAPLIRVKAEDIAAAGIERVPRTVGVRDGLPVLEGGRVMAVSNVVWCTGFQPDYSWVDLPVFADDGAPEYERGVVPSEPGLYFLGLDFLYAFTSENVGGVGRDADRIAKHIASRSARRIRRPLR